MNLPGTTFSPVGLRGPEDPVMATFLATPEGRKLLEEAAQIERTQMGAPPAAAPAAAAPVAPATADPANPAPTTAANPFAALLGGDGDVLTSLLGASAAPPRQTPKMDPWDLLMHLGPALMQAGSRPGASFLGSVGEGLGAGLKAAQGARRDAMTAEQQDRLYNLQRAKLGVDLAQTMKKSEKAPIVHEFYDEETGLPYKAQYDAKTDSWRRVGGVKTGDEKGVKTQLVPIRQPDGSVQQTLVDMRTGEPIKTIGAPDPRPDGKTAVVNVQQPDGSVQQVLLDMRTGQTIQSLGAPKQPNDQTQIIDQTDETGFSRKALIDKRTGKRIAWVDEAHQLKTLPAGGSLIGPEPGGPSSPSSPFAQGVKRNENNTGDPAAKNPVSTATGDGQFIEGTWRGLWPQIARDAAPILAKKGIDPARLTPQQILALRTDPEISAVAIDTYAKQNAPVLRQATGREPTPGELYLAHFLGPGGATQVLQADPSTPISQIVTGDAYSKNEALLRGHTAGSLRASFDRRMGRGQGVAAAPATGAPVQMASADGPVLAPGVREIARGPRVAGNLETEEQKVVGRQLGESYVEYEKGAKSARLTRDRIAQAERLAEGLETGGWTGNLLDLQRNLGSIGIKMNLAGKPPEVARMEALRALANEYALTLRDPSQGSGMPGQMSNFDVQFLSQAANMGLDTTPEGRRLSFEFRKKMAERNIDLAKMAERWRQPPPVGRGSLAGFEAYAADWAERNPLFSTKDVERARRIAAKPAPAALPPAQSLRVTTPTRPDTRGLFDPATKTETVPINEQGGIPRSADGQVDRAKLKQGEVYSVGGKRWRWTGTNFVEVTEAQ